MNKEVIMVIIFRKIKEYEFLLLKRTINKGNFWQPVGGLIENKDKTKLDAAYRETIEETGIKKENVKRVIENFYQFTYDKHYLTNQPINPINEFVYAFEIEPNTKITIDSNQDKEHEQFAWFNYNDAIKKLKWQNNKDAFNKLKQLL